MADIKKQIETIVNFDIAENYYDDDMKKEVVQAFEDILFEDDDTVREFLTKLIDQMKTTAEELDLLPSGEEDFKDDSEEKPEETGEENAEEAPEEVADAGEEAPEEVADADVGDESVETDESYSGWKDGTEIDKFTVSTANKFLSDYDK